MDQTLMPFFWVAITIVVLLLLQRWIQAHLAGISMLLMGKPERAVILYAIILFPGVLLHELSHWIMATLLGVRTGSFSLIPRMLPDGSVQLGYVEYYKGRRLGPIRESLVGGAPLLFGTAVILLIGFRVFSVTNLATAVQLGDIDALAIALSDVINTNDFLVWLYLIFAVSNAMLPSSSDRRAWPAFLLMMVVVAVVSYSLDLQNVVLSELAEPVATIFGYLGIAFSMAIAVDFFFMVIIAGVENLIGRIKGVTVVYGRSEGPPSTEKTLS